MGDRAGGRVSIRGAFWRSRVQPRCVLALPGMGERSGGGVSMKGAGVGCELPVAAVCVERAAGQVSATRNCSCCCLWYPSSAGLTLTFCILLRTRKDTETLNINTDTDTQRMHRHARTRMRTRWLTHARLHESHTHTTQRNATKLEAMPRNAAQHSTAQQNALALSHTHTSAR